LLVEQGHRLTRLVTNILTYARVTDTTDVYSFQRLQVDELVEDALQSFRHITDASTFESTSSSVPISRRFEPTAPP
jgi:K+-sensing histidine kinase KdpD